MGQIKILPEQMINLIAAGEVVERPASIVKELMENALDAGGGQVFISLVDGGKESISVLDNGAGMDGADVRKAVLRHATSKLHSQADLEAISTLGFRGEALASIAAVSRFELLSCHDPEQGGTRISVKGGVEQAAGGVGFPRGTRVTVQELFFNTPARRKFLRSSGTELQHIQTIFTQLALCHPQVHFRLTHNKKTLHNLSASQSLKERVFQLFGAEMAEGMVPAAGREGTVCFEGLISLPSRAFSSRRWQYLFVNGRPIKHAGIQHGIYQAYRTLLMKERHPAYVLMLTLPLSEVDVNVHPAKTEVRLRNSQLIHTVLADRLHKTLFDASRRRAFATGAETPDWQARPAAPPARSDESQAELPLGPAVHDFQQEPALSTVAWGRAGPQAMVGQVGTGQVETGQVQPPDSTSLLENPYAGGDFYFQPLSSGAAPGLPQADSLGGSAMVVLGQFHRTYLLAQRGERLVVVDQHAAHERILFEQYRHQFYQSRLFTEAYLIPITLELSAQNGLLLEQYLPQWEKLGFVIEPFGKGTYLVRQVPALLSGKDVAQLIMDVLDDLALFGKSGRVEEVINEILERVACHGAIRAGMTLSVEEMAGLFEQLEQVDINLYCPHGRPVWVEIDLKELEKRFKRIV